MKRHDITEMRSYYAQWLSSGLGKKAFARQAGLSVSTFYYWASKFEKGSVTSTVDGFEPIKVASPGLGTPTAVVRYPNGVSIEWHGGPDSLHMLKGLV